MGYHLGVDISSVSAKLAIMNETGTASIRYPVGDFLPQARRQFAYAGLDKESNLEETIGARYLAPQKCHSQRAGLYRMQQLPGDWLRSATSFLWRQEYDTDRWSEHYGDRPRRWLRKVIGNGIHSLFCCRYAKIAEH